jgi:hypothetical protein
LNKGSERGLATSDYVASAQESESAVDTADEEEDDEGEEEEEREAPARKKRKRGGEDNDEERRHTSVAVRPVFHNYSSINALRNALRTLANKPRLSKNGSGMSMQDRRFASTMAGTLLQSRACRYVP